jgi:CRISPR/Cas system-associated exonuclease Cas4 (RecB family)
MATRQQRLSGFEPASEANYHVVRKPLLSASTLASFLVCNTKPFVQRILEVFGIEVTSAAMRRGAAAHAEVQGAFEALTPKSELTFREALARKEFVLGTEIHLLDEQRRLHGYVDIMFADGGRLHILELKNSRPPRQPDPTWGQPVWPDHGMQAHLYGLLGRTETGVTPSVYLSYLRDGSKEAVLESLADQKDPARSLRILAEKSVALPHGPAERAKVLHEVQAFQKAERGLEVPMPNHADPYRCGSCSVKAWCPRRLDQPGRFLVLDAKKLMDLG